MAGVFGNVKGGPRDAQDATTSPRRAGASFRRWLKHIVPEQSATGPDAPLAADAAGPAIDAPFVPPAAIDSEPAPSSHAHPDPAADRDLAAICGRFEDMTRKLESLVKAAADPIIASAPAPGNAPIPPIRMSPLPSGDRSLDDAVSEIAARQRALEAASGADASPAAPSMFAPGLDVAAGAVTIPSADMARLEDHLKLITAQLESLRAPCRADEMMASLREELRDIGRAVHDGVPRHAFEALGAEVRALGEKLDATRHGAVDSAALEPLERALANVQSTLDELAPTQLASSINTLFHKLDQVAPEQASPVVLDQLDGAIEALRDIVTHVASGEALAGLSREVRELAEKIADAPVAPDTVPPEVLAGIERQLADIAETLSTPAAVPALASEGEAAAEPARVSDTLEPLMVSLSEKLSRFDATEGRDLAPIEERIDDLGDKLSRIGEQSVDSRALTEIESRMRILADKLDHLESTSREQPGLAPLEAKITDLAVKVQSSESRLDVLPAIERGMSDLVLHMTRLVEQQSAGGAAAPVLDAMARDIESIKVSQDEAERRTRLSLDETKGTIGRIADRLATLESGLRTEPPMFVAPPAATPPVPDTPSEAPAPEIEPEPTRPSGLAIRLGLGRGSKSAVEAPAPVLAAADDALPPDAPIEPGAGSPWSRGGRSAAERIAESKAILGAATPPAAPDGRSNFILAARRAAQAASEQQAQVQAATGTDGRSSEKSGRKLTDRMKSLFATTSVIVIGLALVPIGLRAIDVVTRHEPSASQIAAVVPSNAYLTKRPIVERPDTIAPPAELAAAARALVDGSPTAKALMDRHIGKLPDTARSLLAPPKPLAEASQAATSAAPAIPPVAVAAPSVTAPAHTGPVPAVPLPAQPAQIADAGPEITTGAIAPRASVPAATPITPAPLANDAADAWPTALPPGLASKRLVAALAARSPSAAYEIAMRYAEGRGVAADLSAAAMWLTRAAEGGLAPAQFRLGGLYEKGQGVTKNLAEAKRLYLAAAGKGNGSAMHNLAVLFAEGADGKPDYATAVEWFEKAAQHGVPDSQYNLAILNARGVGTAQNLAEAYKWFAIVAQRGDPDAAKKREDIAARLDQQTLTAARLAAQTFAPAKVPEEAVTVSPPPGGWEDATAGTKPKSKRLLEQSARL